MCLSCGCMEPEADHEVKEHITLQTLQAAAQAGGVSPQQAAENILKTYKEKVAGSGEQRQAA